jgi:hypothetical protein
MGKSTLHQLPQLATATHPVEKKVYKGSKWARRMMFLLLLINY